MFKGTLDVHLGRLGPSQVQTQLEFLKRGIANPFRNQTLGFKVKPYTDR